MRGSIRASTSSSLAGTSGMVPSLPGVTRCSGLHPGSKRATTKSNHDDPSENSLGLDRSTRRLPILVLSNHRPSGSAVTVDANDFDKGTPG